jgi:hypothetical protein
MISTPYLDLYFFEDRSYLLARGFPAMQGIPLEKSFEA